MVNGEMMLLLKQINAKLDALIDALSQDFEESVVPQKDLHGNTIPQDRNQDMPL